MPVHSWCEKAGPLIVVCMRNSAAWLPRSKLRVFQPCLRRVNAIVFDSNAVDIAERRRTNRPATDQLDPTTARKRWKQGFDKGPLIARAQVCSWNPIRHERYLKVSA